MSKAAAEEDSGLSAALVIYGLLADILAIGPIILYLLLDDTARYAKFHHGYINMLMATYGPLAILWPSAIFADGPQARKMIEGVVQMAGLGPFSLLWIGYFTFLMGSREINVLKESDNTTFAVIYGLGNVFLAICHWVFSNSIYEWVALAPLADYGESEEAKEETAKDEAEAAKAEEAESEDQADGW